MADKLIGKPMVDPTGSKSSVDEVRIPVLVVDDSPSDLFIAQAILRKLDDKAFQVEAAACVAEARSKIESGLEPQVVISDLVMPEETGLDFYRWLQEKRPAWTDRFVLRTQGSGKPELAKFVNEMSEKGRLIFKGDIESERRKIAEILAQVLKKG